MTTVQTLVEKLSREIKDGVRDEEPSVGNELLKRMDDLRLAVIQGLIHSYCNKHDLEKAHQYYTSQVKEVDSEKKIVLLDALIADYKRAKKFKEAVQLYEDSKLKPTEKTHALVISCLLESDQMNKAIEWRDQHPAQPTGFNNFMGFFYRKKKPDFILKALGEMAKSKIAPNRKTHCLVVEAHVMKGETKKAKEVYRQQLRDSLFKEILFPGTKKEHPRVNKSQKGVAIDTHLVGTNTALLLTLDVIEKYPNENTYFIIAGKGIHTFKEDAVPFETRDFLIDNLKKRQFDCPINESNPGTFFCNHPLQSQWKNRGYNRAMQGKWR